MKFRREHSFERFFYIFKNMINDTVKAYVKIFLFCKFFCIDIRTHPEADNNGIGSRSKQNVSFSNLPDTLVNDLYLDLIILNFHQSICQRLNRAIGIRLDNDAQLFHQPFLDLAGNTVKLDTGAAAEIMLPTDNLTFLRQVACLPVGHHNGQRIS